MPKSRRHFLATTSLGLLGAAVALDGQTQNPPTQAPAVHPTEAPPPGMPPAFGTGPLVGPEVSPATFAEAEKLVQIELTESRACGRRCQLARKYGRAIRAAHRPAQDCAGAFALSGDALEPDAAGNEIPARAQSIYSQLRRARPLAVELRRNRLRARDPSLALDRAPANYFRTAYEYLSAANRGVRSQTPLRHHADAPNWRSRRRKKPTPKLPPENIAARCTASRSA